MACACKNKKQNVEAPKQEEPKNEVVVDLSSDENVSGGKTE